MCLNTLIQKRRLIMTIIIGSDVDGKRLKEVVKAFLKENN